MPSVPMTMIGTDHVRQDLREHDAQVAIAERSCRLHIALSCLTDSVEARAIRQVKDQLVRPSAISRLVRPGSEHGHDGQREDQRGDGEHDIGQAVDEIVPPAAPIAGGQSRARRRCTVLIELRDDADRQRDARAVQHAAE
jgi:hypothetical protein